MRRRPSAPIAALTVALLAAGCASPPTAGPSVEPAPAAATATATATAQQEAATLEARRAIERGIELFERGRFAESVRTLQESPEIVAAPAALRVQALKYVAFGQCVTARRLACRRTVDALLALEPGFALLPAEAGHPAWGPEFERAIRQTRASR
jgi:hypothetical protein